jgi:hypothetical protein
LAEARVGYREYSGDPIALCVAYTGQGGYRLEGCCFRVLLWGVAGSQLGVVTEKLGVVRKFNVVRTLSLTL